MYRMFLEIKVSRGPKVCCDYRPEGHLTWPAKTCSDSGYWVWRDSSQVM